MVLLCPVVAMSDPGVLLNDVMWFKSSQVSLDEMLVADGGGKLERFLSPSIIYFFIVIILTE